MKKIFLLLMFVSVFSLAGCKEFAKDVGDAGNSLGKTVDDTINRDKD